MMIFGTDQHQPVMMTDDGGSRYVDLGDDRVVIVGDPDGERAFSHLAVALYSARGVLHTQNCRAEVLPRYFKTCKGGEHCAELEREWYGRNLGAIAYAVANPDVIA